VPEPQCLDRKPPDLVATRSDVLDRQRRRRLVERHREHDRVHLLSQNHAEVDVPLLRPPHPDHVAVAEHRREEREALDVVPVGVRQQ